MGPWGKWLGHSWYALKGMKEVLMGPQISFLKRDIINRVRLFLSFSLPSVWPRDVSPAPAVVMSSMMRSSSEPSQCGGMALNLQDHELNKLLFFVKFSALGISLQYQKMDKNSGP